MKRSLSTEAIHHPNTQWPHQICIINTAWREKWWTLLEPLGVFSPTHVSLAHFWRVSPVPLCLNYLTMPSWDAIIQTLIPCNFHTSVCTLTCLMFTITHGGASCFFPYLEDQRHAHILKRKGWGGVLTLGLVWLRCDSSFWHRNFLLCGGLV